MQGMKLYGEMAQRSGKIQEMCDVALTENEDEDISNCLSVMNTFNEGVKQCKRTSSSVECSCWADLVGTVDSVTEFR